MRTFAKSFDDYVGLGNSLDAGAISSRAGELLYGRMPASSRAVVAPDASPEDAAAAAASPEALAVEALPAPSFSGYLADGSPDWTLHALAVSNDPGYTGGQLYGMYGDATTPANQYGSQTGEAWAAGFTGAMNVAVGVIDTGVDYRHQDLYLNIYINQNEISSLIRPSLIDTDGDLLITFRDLNQSANSGFVTDLNANGRIDGGDLLADTRWENGTDQDGNGYVDDLIGWDFVNNDNDAQDGNSHGTHVAGTIGALGGNGTGVAGVNWNVQIVPLKFLADSGSGSTSDAIEAIDYFTGQSTRNPSVNFVATNNSWGGGGFSAPLQTAIVNGAREDILFIAASGNGGPDQIGDNNDVVQNYPSNYSTTAGAGYEAVVAVASTTSSGGLSGFSNYGVNTVDLGAPGSSVYSTLPNGGYGYKSGTSMATPHVAGAVALYAAANSGASAAEIRAALLDSVIDTASLAGKSVTGGRLDVAALLSGVAPPGGVTLNGTSGNDRLNGTEFADTLNGLAGNDTLDGKGGADRMNGGTGNDIFYVENAGDVVVELSGQGLDSVRSTLASYTLAANVERLYLDGAGNQDGVGNTLANILNGNDGANYLRGLGGTDTINGGGGNDRLDGGDGTDTLVGGDGADTLTGGAGRDRFDFNSVAEIGLGGARDVLTDFVRGSDRLDFSTIDAISGTGPNDAFALIGSNAFSGVAGQLRAAIVGGNTLVQGDVNGDAVADFELQLTGVVTPLQPADFIV